MVAEIVEVEENSSTSMRNLRIPPVITVNKSAAYALYELTYIRDVAYKPEELYVQTRKCEPDAGADIVGNCERQVIFPICCPCGDQRRVPSSCGNFFDKVVKGKANTAHCLRFPGDWFQVFGIGQRSLGFSIQIEVKTATKTSDVVVGPESRTATSKDNFLQANLIGDYVGYTNIPSFEDYYLVTPRQGGPGQPQKLGTNFSMWMLLEKVRFTLDGFDCNKIGLGYEAFNKQPDFCSAPFWSCLHNQLWNFWESDMNRVSRNQSPLYVVQGRFERINQHPDSGSHSFSIGITEVLNTNLLIELSADDLEYVYQRSPGKILSIAVPTFEALTQFGTATITTENIGEVEASYSLTFDCSTGVSQMQEQFYIMKPKEVTSRSFKLYPTTDQAAKYACAAILKDSGFNKVDRAECQFTTTATVVDNGSQIPFQLPKTSINGFFESIENLWNKFWNALADFITGKTCRRKCSGMFDFRCHIQYICMSWILMFGLLLAIFPTVVGLLWLLHEKGFFNPLYDWWEDHFYADEQSTVLGKRGSNDLSRLHFKKHHKHKGKHPQHDNQKKRRSVYEHRHNHSAFDGDYHYYLHHVHKDKYKHGRIKGTRIKKQLDKEENDHLGHHRIKKEKKILAGPSQINRYNHDREDTYKHKHGLVGEKDSRLHVKQRE
ncbi:hypothetical protein NMG60_11030415 [Bertholletia excelsa]